MECYNINSIIFAVKYLNYSRSFLTAIGESLIRLNSSYFIDATNAIKSRIFNSVFNYKPKYLLIGKIE
jgi:hypothetical protein